MYRVGVDLGGTNIAAGVIDGENRLVAAVSIPTNASRAPEEIISDICRLVSAALDKASVAVSECASIGIGVPGTCVPQTGVVAYACNLGWRNVALIPAVKRRFDVPVFIGNDADCAALAEYAAGAGRGAENMVLITLGTGIGMGAVINGKLLAGKNGAGPEIGHTTIIFDGEKCTCGRRGCWEAYASGSALVRQAARAAKENPDSLLAKLDISGGRAVFDAAEKGDATAAAVIERYCGYVAEGMANVVNAFAPDILLVGGGVCRAGEKFIARIRALTAELIFDKRPEAMPVIKAAQFENEAGIIGAALLGAGK